MRVLKQIYLENGVRMVSVHTHHLYIWPAWFDVKGLSFEV